MQKIQTGYNPQPELTQITATPNTPLVQAHQPSQAGAGAARLAEALGAVSKDFNVKGVAKQEAEEQEARALAARNSTTAEKFLADLKDQNKMNSENPLYVAAARNIGGKLMYEDLKRRATSMIDTGQLKPEQVDSWLVAEREKSLAGFDKFTIAGFDKEFGTLRSAASDYSSKRQDKLFTDNTEQNAQQLMVENVRSAQTTFKTNPEAALAAIHGQYGQLTATGVYTDPGKQRLLWKSVVTNLRDGEDVDPAFMKAVLDSSTPDGKKVSTLVDFGDPAFSLTAVHKANTAYKQTVINEHLKGFSDQIRDGSFNLDGYKAWAAKEPLLTYGQYNAIINAWESQQHEASTRVAKVQLQMQSADSLNALKSLADLAYTNGTFNAGAPFVAAKWLTAEGKEESWFEASKKYMTEKLTAETANLPLDSRVAAWKRSGLPDPQLVGVVSTGMQNLASVTMAAKGKPLGELNKQASDAIDTYNQIHNIDPAYADKIAGEYAPQMKTILAALHIGASKATAAQWASNYYTSTSRDVVENSKTKAQIRSEVEAALSPGLREWAGDPVGNAKRSLRELFGYQPDVSTDNIAADAIDSIAAIYSGGKVPLGEATATVLSYIKKTNTVVRGNVFPNNALPHDPNGSGEEAKWMDRFIAEKVKWDYKTFTGIEDSSKVRLNYDPRTASFTAMLGGNPVSNSRGQPLRYSKADVNWWAQQTNLRDRKRRAVEVKSRPEAVPFSEGF